ncbi:hypothetical protein COCSADRAFT_278734 [Bipolaris sorokiniana ND90Pr]|uniref:Secreted protein n=1 Tax=Cochliobolus sativus (strain ND90Pr / ATCC 201652) TaxID=665912 RepID=M2QT82_COCSN|nr:uncharacterized protein COCSADRAFT_278734 [Bipolaris sorokiniana ND90Pr]EMD58384.1 hypothetical protein COCSADRAFT_278734 [Bipolaris sorokiniana ND90Pr]
MPTPRRKCTLLLLADTIGVESAGPFCQTTPCSYMYLATESPWNNTCRPDMCLWHYARHEYSLGTGGSAELPLHWNKPGPAKPSVATLLMRIRNLGWDTILRGQYIVVCSSGRTVHVVLLVVVCSSRPADG